MTRRPLIGVLGGLGPAATVDFYAKVVALAREAGATRDQEHVRLLIDADPEVPNRNESVAGIGESSAPALVAKAQRLKAAGAELLVMACNAAHVYEREITAATGLELVGIVETAVAAVMRAAPTATRVGVLAAAGTLDAGLYRTALEERGLGALEPEGELRERFMDLLYRIKSGDTGAAMRGAMGDVAAALVARGAQALVAGCTEVPLVLGPSDVAVPLVDATAALAEAVVERGSRAATEV